MHFRQFRPNLHNIFSEEAVLCLELEKSTTCMDYPIRTTPDSFEKPHYFYAESIRNGSAAHQLAASTLKCWRKKQVPAAICITFHTNFTIRPGGHSNFRRSRRFPSVARRPHFANINFSLAIPPNRPPGTHFTALPLKI